MNDLSVLSAALRTRTTDRDDAKEAKGPSATMCAPCNSTKAGFSNHREIGNVGI
jgi:hypothetical protein